MKQVHEYIEEWCGNDSIKKYLANVILAKQEINLEEIIDNIFDIYRNKKDITIVEHDNGKSSPLQLCINNVKRPQNIGALCDETEFELGKKLNVFYGENGSGKSTYVKIFRKLSENYFTNAKDLSLKTNIYKEKNENLQSFCISYQNGDSKVSEEDVDINAYHRELSKINVFDSDSLQPLLNKDLSFSILPKGLDNFVKLTELLGNIKKQISERILVLENEMSGVFQDSMYKEVIEKINEIAEKATTESDVIDFLNKQYTLKENLQLEIENKQLSISQMKTTNQANLIQILNAQQIKLSELSNAFKSIEKDFSNEKICNVVKLQEQYNRLMSEEKTENERLATQVNNITINSEWNSFIKVAQKYYNSQKQTLPTSGNRCILCGRQIEQEQEAFIKFCFKHLEGSVNSLKSKLEGDIKREIPTDKHLRLSEADKQLFDQDRAILLSKIEAILELIEKNITLFRNCVDNNKEVPNSCKIDFSGLILELEKAHMEVSERLNLLSKSNGEILDNIKKQENELRELENACLLYESQLKFKQLFDCRNKKKEYGEIQKKMRTTELTTKSQEAFNDLIGSNYQKIFEEYCVRLGIKNVSVKLTPKRGETKRSKYLVSENNAITDIMSEGEQKAIALAEFSSDLKIRENMCTVLFDDPVTSFDYKRAEIIAEIIYEISKERQVVVFTHNIMFYYKIYSLIEKEKDKENRLFKVDEFDRDNKGVISHTDSGRLENLKDVTNRITNSNQIINSKKCMGDELERNLQITYSDIRTWCELIVEEGFLRGIIRRYEPNVRFTMVPKINPDFVGELPKVHSLYEKACRYMTGHSQPVETLNTKPTREEFKEDFVCITEIYEKFH
ncbi:AAA family ATPase [Clostridium boliviensis]|uniref:AAA family ATPase n=1 Tax=Clostridium boliviensis TaxID=318465 RepID=A0ABU4GL01_9CLOT|nr:AAA family ATPase [Clostridium boliviensis]MDW2797623.1 AAA family ATPase [Clostridium boliviensis]